MAGKGEGCALGGDCVCVHGGEGGGAWGERGRREGGVRGEGKRGGRWVWCGVEMRWVSGVGWRWGQWGGVRVGKDGKRA